jgi:predicted RNA-binding Zn-ribbon protein involved in translation (DUF1610 family)
MQCPHCGAEMTAGRFDNQGEKWHNHAFGSFGLPLTFDDGEAAEPENVWIGDREGATGHHCPACGAVVLDPPEPEEEWICPACGVVVPGRFHNCWKCQCPKP